MNSKKTVLILISLLVACATLTAQAPMGSISGIVIDANNEEPLTGATIFIEETKNGIAADRNGGFTMDGLKDANYKITFSYLGYNSQTQTINITAENRNRKKMVIRLAPVSISLKEVTITAKTEARKIRQQAMPVSVISMKQLQGTVSSVEDILSKTVGVTIRASGGVGSASRLSVRGLEGKRIGFFID